MSEGYEIGNKQLKELKLLEVKYLDASMSNMTNKLEESIMLHFR